MVGAVLEIRALFRRLASAVQARGANNPACRPPALGLIVTVLKNWAAGSKSLPVQPRSYIAIFLKPARPPFGGEER